MSTSLSITATNHVAEVVLATEGKGNALGPSFFPELGAAFVALDRDPNVRAVVLRADGPHFTYGLNLPAVMAELGGLFQGGLADARATLRETILAWQGAITAIAACRKPVIASVHGLCLGGGVDVITACDVRVCSQDARFSVREVKVAMVADIGTLQRLPRIVGEGHARELALSGRDFDANRALRIGLVNDVYPSKEETLAAARKLAFEIADNSPLAVQGVKEVLNERIREEDDAGLRYVAAYNSAFLPSLDLGEALAAFVEKRKASFTGR